MEIVYGKHINWFYVYVRYGIDKMSRAKKSTYHTDTFKMSESAKEYFNRMTYELSEHDRHDLILDYFDKIQTLLEQDIAWLVQAVQKIDPEEKVMIKRRMDRLKKSRGLSQDIDFLVTEYKKGGGRD